MRPDPKADDILIDNIDDCMEPTPPVLDPYTGNSKINKVVKNEPAILQQALLSAPNLDTISLRSSPKNKGRGVKISVSKRSINQDSDTFSVISMDKKGRKFAVDGKQSSVSESNYDPKQIITEVY